jgi:hypothetical protein
VKEGCELRPGIDPAWTAKRIAAVEERAKLLGSPSLQEHDAAE